MFSHQSIHYSLGVDLIQECTFQVDILMSGEVRTAARYLSIGGSFQPYLVSYSNGLFTDF